MNRVFPEQMNAITLTDDKGKFTEIERYIRYMCERIEYAVNTMIKKEEQDRNIPEATTTTAGLMPGSAVQAISDLQSFNNAMHQSGSVDPDSSVIGLVGSVYVNKVTDAVFVCTAVSPMTWTRV